MAPQARGQAASAFGDFRHRELATRTGRNYKLLPALLAFSPPDCLRSASRWFTASLLLCKLIF